jgi:hypothetical protein
MGMCNNTGFTRRAISRIGGIRMKRLDNKDLVLTLKLAREIGCEEPFLCILIIEIKRRESQGTMITFPTPT